MTIFQIVLSLKTFNYCYETDELPNPRKDIGSKVAFGPHFPAADIFSWVGIGYMWETDCKKPNPTKLSANTLLIMEAPFVQ